MNCGTVTAMDKDTRNAKDRIALKFVETVLVNLLVTEAHVATKYITPRFILRATRKLSNKRIDRRDSKVEIVLTIGSPNYLERDFIRDCKKSSEPFPIKGVILKFPPEPRKKK